MENLGSYVIYIILITGVFGLFFSYKLPNIKAKSILVVIFFSFLTEFLGRNIPAWTGLKNYIVFNIYILVIFSYYILILRELYKNIFYKKISALFLLFFFLIYFIDLVFMQNILNEMLTYAFSIAVIFVLILSSIYLIEIFNSDKVLYFKKSIYFWFILGVLIFYIPLLPYMIVVKMFLKFSDQILGIVLFSLNLLMYSCFIIGFICSEKKQNY